MKFNVAVLAVLATTLAGAPLIASAADTSGSAPAPTAQHKAKHMHHHKASKKSKKSSSASSEASAPK